MAWLDVPMTHQWLGALGAVLLIPVFVRREGRQVRDTAREAVLAWWRNPEGESAGAD